MAAKNSMPERAVAQTEVAVSENNVEIREQVHKRTRVRFTGNAPGLNVFTPEGDQALPAANFIPEWIAIICRWRASGCPASDFVAGWR